MKYIVYNRQWNIRTRPFDKLSEAKKHIDINVREQLSKVKESADYNSCYKEIFSFSDKVFKAMEKEVRDSFIIEKIRDREDLLRLVTEGHSIIKNLPYNALSEEAEDWLMRTDNIFRGIEK